MKIKEGFVLRQMAGTTVVIPSGDALDMDVMITLNDTGRFLWQHMEQETSVDGLTEAVLKEYDIEESAARAYVEKFVARLKELDFLG